VTDNQANSTVRVWHVPNRSTEKAVWATTKRVAPELDKPPESWEEFIQNYTPHVRLILSRRGMKPQDLEDGVQDVFTYCMRTAPSDGKNVLTRYSPDRGSFRRYIIGMLYVRCSEAIEKYMGGVKDPDTGHYIKRERQFALDEDGNPFDVEDTNPDDPLGDILALDTSTEIMEALRETEAALSEIPPTPTRDFALLFRMVMEQVATIGRVNATALAEPYGMACEAHRPFSRQAINQQYETLKMLPPMQKLRKLLFAA
jgi:DNA-directed RNA polymerase specialized sigma24 family protein